MRALDDTHNNTASQLVSAIAREGLPTLKAAEVLAGKYRAVFRRTYCEVRCVPIAEAAVGVPCDATSDASQRETSLLANTRLPSYAMCFNTARQRRPCRLHCLSILSVTTW